MRALVAVVALLLAAGCTDPVAQGPSSSTTTAPSPTTAAPPAGPDATAPPATSETEPEPAPEPELPPEPAPPPKPPAVAAPRVVVATFDTGTNPFHPCWKRPGLDAAKHLPGLPATAVPLVLADGTYEDALRDSKAALDSIRPETLYHVPGTPLLFYGGGHASTEFIDDYTHGAQASSQIACPQYGMADAWVVVLNFYDWPEEHVAKIDWVAAQPWIDVVHLNIQDLPTPYTTELQQAVARLVAAGPMAVMAAGNGVAGGGAPYPTEVSSLHGTNGVLQAGANDNGGYTSFSNLDPDVVMDGAGTVAAAPDGEGDADFGGTSSASPRVTGYVAQLVASLREALGPGSGRDGMDLVRVPEGRARPAAGPLADGALTAAELHEAVRKTADPNPHDSKWDGTRSFDSIPQPVDLPFAFYPKMGYGEVSEHTFPHALAVLLGTEPMPDRPVEDAFWEASRTVRSAYWG